MNERALCGICGEPMPKGEEMFNYHGYSGPCPKPPKARAGALTVEREETKLDGLIRGIVQASLEMAALRNDLCYYDEPPISQEQCAELVEDTWKALRGIDCACADGPVPEYTEFHKAWQARAAVGTKEKK